MNYQTTLNLKTQCEIWKAKAETWKQAFKLLVIQEKRQEKGTELGLASISPTEIIRQEQAASKFVQNIVLPKIEETFPQEGEVGVQFSWVATIGEFILNQIKQQAPIFIAKVLEDLKEKAIPYAMQIIEWLMEKVQDYLYICWQSLHTEEERQALKERIINSFPDSSLAKRLQEN